MENKPCVTITKKKCVNNFCHRFFHLLFYGYGMISCRTVKYVLYTHSHIYAHIHTAITGYIYIDDAYNKNRFIFHPLILNYEFILKCWIVFYVIHDRTPQDLYVFSKWNIYRYHVHVMYGYMYVLEWLGMVRQGFVFMQICISILVFNPIEPRLWI